MTSATTCGYEACLCTRPYKKENLAGGTRYIDPNAEFCSDRCAFLTGDDEAHGGCECGHPECETLGDKSL
jgi:hypothetical protein